MILASDLLHLFGETGDQFLPHIPDFRYILYDLSRFPDEAIKGAVMFRVTMLLFKYVFQPDYRDRLPGIFASMRSLVDQETTMQYIEAVIRYVLSTVENMEAIELKIMVEESLSPEKGEVVMTLAEKLKNEGIQQGIEQGIQQGIQQGILEGLQQGIVEGLQEGIELGLGIKFGARGLKLMPAIRLIQDAGRLKAIKEAVKIAGNIKQVKEVISD